jgi:hypothetical protein
MQVTGDLFADIPWRAEHVGMWGQCFPLPRLTFQP